MKPFWQDQPVLVTGAIDRVQVVRRDIRDRDLLERTIGEYKTSTVIHLAARTIVGIARTIPWYREFLV
jgi:CDP-glucose 4,6-dehydratase